MKGFHLCLIVFSMSFLQQSRVLGFFVLRTLHFYNLKSSLSQPQMMVVAEVDDPFLPLPDDMLVNLKDSRDVVDSLLDNLAATFASTQIVESAMGSALQV